MSQRIEEKFSAWPEIILGVGAVAAILLAGFISTLGEPQKVDFRTGQAIYKLDDPKSGEGWIQVDVVKENGFDKRYPIDGRALDQELLRHVPVAEATFKDYGVGTGVDRSGQVYMVWRVFFTYKIGGAQ